VGNEKTLRFYKKEIIIRRANCFGIISREEKRAIKNKLKNQWQGQII
jgi:hypothetical protein